jgi:hypothetical protein
MYIIGAFRNQWNYGATAVVLFAGPESGQCSLLTSFVGRLSPPLQRPDERALPPWGYTVFQSIGCATCHAQTLGTVTGLYSDLLLHDMGQASSDSATYYGAPIDPRSTGELADDIVNIKVYLCLTSAETNARDRSGRRSSLKNAINPIAVLSAATADVGNRPSLASRERCRFGARSWVK